MTAAERQKAYRERQKQKDQESTLYFTVSGELAESLINIAESFEISKRQAVSDLINSALKGLLPILNEAADDITNKTSAEGLTAQEVTEHKHAIWKYLLNQFEG